MKQNDTISYSEFNYVKPLFLLGAMLISLLGINVIKLIAVDNGASVNVQKILDTSYIAFLWFSVTVISILFIYFLWKIALGFKLRKEKEIELTYDKEDLKL